LAEIGEIPKRLNRIFAEAAETGEATNLIADRMARRIVAAAGD
jgi:hypothetical protein